MKAILIACVSLLLRTLRYEEQAEKPSRRRPVLRSFNEVGGYDGRDAGNSLPAQLARLERYCQNKGFQIIQTCSFDESAYTNDRSEVDRIIDLILNQTEKVAACCDKVDRLSRNVFDKRISILSAVEKFQFSISLGLAKC